MEWQNVTVITLISINVEQYILLPMELNRFVNVPCGRNGIRRRQSEKAFRNGKIEMR
jgi:hypothetical protein